MTAPAARPWTLALRVLWRAWKHWTVDECGHHAAAIAYFSLLAFFPFVILLGSVASLLVGGDAADIRHALDPLRPLLPELRPGAWERLQRLIDNRGLLSAASMVGLVWLSSRLTLGVDTAFGAIFKPSDGASPRPGPLRRLAAIGMTLAAMVALGLVLTVMMLVEILLHSTHSPDWIREAVESAFFTRHAVPVLLLAGLGYALFTLLPRVEVAVRHRVAGALFFAVAHDLAVTAVARFAGLLAPRDYVYGPFVGAVTFAAWTWLAASLLLLSAELVAELNGNRQDR